MKTTRRFLNWTVTPALTLGAVLLLGLLSFTGMFVLYPILGLAITTFVLSVIYEAEIYKQNINKALDKLLDENLLIQSLGKQALFDLQEQLKGNNNNHWFSNDYYNLSNHPKKTSGDRERLKKMERWFGQILLAKEGSSILEFKFAHNLKNEISEITQNIDWEMRYDSLRFYNRLLLVFSAVASILMSLGTIYLLLDTLAVLTFFSFAPLAAPFVIIPLALVAGMAYGFLTYNSLSEFILKNDMFEWVKSFFQADTYKNPKNIGIAIFGVFVIALNIGLTICTAGTWWVIINQSRPLWGWMQNTAISLLQKATPIVIAVATLGFNGQNTIQTIKQIAPHDHSHEHSPAPAPTKPAPFNPFDYILKLVYFPIRLLMFVGHLLSISVTSDQMPGIPQVMAAFFAFLSEFLEDGHYFLDMEEIKSMLGIASDDCEDHEDDHHHSDIPNYFLQFIFSPIFLSAAAYDYYFNQDPDHVMDFKTCLYKKLKWEDENPNDHLPSQKVVSNNWLRVEANMLVTEQLDRLNHSSWDQNLINQKRKAIENFKNNGTLQAFYTLQTNPAIKQHRFWGISTITRTEEMVHELSSLVKVYTQPRPETTPVNDTNQTPSNKTSIIEHTAYDIEKIINPNNIFIKNLTSLSPSNPQIPKHSCENPGVCASIHPNASLNNQICMVTTENTRPKNKRLRRQKSAHISELAPIPEERSSSSTVEEGATPALTP